jgi:hypothetical protein
MVDVFVVMPFGLKILHEPTKTTEFDFDCVYRQLIIPACAAIDLSARRIDEVSFSGVISSEIVKHLFTSDIVIADLTTANPNVYSSLASGNP